MFDLIRRLIARIHQCTHCGTKIERNNSSPSQGACSDCYYGARR